MLEDMTNQSAMRVSAGVGESFWLATDLHTFKVVGEDTGGAFTFSELTAHPQFGPPPHIHHREDESFYVLEGEFEFMDEGRVFTADAGSFVHLPRGRLHAHRAVGDAPARALVLVTPAGVEKFIEEAGEPAVDTYSVPPPPEMPDLQRIVEIARKYGLEVPPPGGEREEEAGEATIRPAVAADVEVCGRIIYEAFKGMADRHRFPPDFPAVEASTQLAASFIDHPSIFGVVAEYDGRVVGSNFLDEHDPVRGVGPITVDPRVQERGIGRRLMKAVLERGRGAASIRLLQDSFNVSSASLYASLGFDVKEPVLLMSGKPRSELPPGVEVRPLTSEDLSPCADLCEKVRGFDRGNELRDALEIFSPHVALREGRIVAYASALAFWPLNHGVAETEEDMKALLLGAGAVSGEPLSFLLPARQASFFRWCLSEGLRVVKPMTLMATGDYQEPDGCYVVSVLS